MEFLCDFCHLLVLIKRNKSNGAYLSSADDVSSPYIVHDTTIVSLWMLHIDADVDDDVDM